MKESKIIGWAKRLQALSQSGAFYTKNEFDIQKFEEIREISAEMMAFVGDEDLEKVKDIFLDGKGYQTPKLDVRAAIFKDDKILLVQDTRGHWALPGGYVDITDSVQEALKKECLEEAGRIVEFNKLVSVVDQSASQLNASAYSYIKMYAIMDEISGEFKENPETVAAEYFPIDDLPELGRYRTTPDQIRLCYEASLDDCWKTIVE